MTEAERLAQLAAKCDRLRREADQREGALRQTMSRLKAEHGCGSLEEAKKLLIKRKKECESLRQKRDAKLKEMEGAYGDPLSGA